MDKGPCDCNGGGCEKASPSPTEKPPRCSPDLDWRHASSSDEYIIQQYTLNVLVTSEERFRGGCQFDSACFEKD
jgi:hypothetical protein